MNSPSLNSSQESNSNTPKNKKRKGSDSTPKKRKRNQSESSGDENWVRPDKCITCQQIFSDDPFKWNRHNIERHTNSHKAKIDNSPTINSPKINTFFSK